MAAVWYRARAELRRRWKATVGLALLIALVGAVVLTVVAGARRSASGFDRFLDMSLAADATIFYSDPARLAQVERLPQVEVVGRIVAPLFAPLPSGPEGRQFLIVAGPGGRFLGDVDRVRVVRGRAPDPDRPDELTVNEQVAADHRLAVGQQVTLRSFASEQFEALGANPEPAGPSVTARVVGVVRAPSDVADLTSEDLPAAYLTPAFYRAYGEAMATFDGVSRIRLRDGQADLAAFSEAANRIFADDTEFAIQPASAEVARVQDAIDVVVIGLLLFAAAAGLAGLVAVGQALGRWLSNAQPDEPTLAGLGMSRAERTAAAGLALAPAVLGGALLAGVGAALASPLMPISIARQAEPDPGFSLDSRVLGLGVVALVLVLGAFTIAAAWHRTRMTSSSEAPAPGPSRPSAVASAIAAAGLPPALTAGARMAFEPGRGRTAVPVRAGLAGVILGIASLAAVTVFVASQTALVGTPAHYGWNWDASVPGQGLGGGGPSVVDRHGADLAADPAVADLAAVSVSHIEIPGAYLHVVAFSDLKGSIEPTILEGRSPQGADEVVLGTATLRRFGRSVGASMESPGANGPITLRIVGRAAIPSLNTDAVADDGVVMTGEGAEGLATTQSHSELLVNWARGTDEEAARGALEERVGTVVTDKPPSDVVNLERIRAIPRALAVFFALLGVLAVGHTLVTAVRRRGRDLAVLKALGLGPGQVWAAVAWQASLVVIAGLALGVPIGVAAGRWAWTLVADGVGVVNRPEVPLVGLAALLPAALLIANVVAAFPAWAAARTRPALVLRAE